MPPFRRHERFGRQWGVVLHLLYSGTLDQLVHIGLPQVSLRTFILGLNESCLLPQTTYHVILNNRVVLHCRMQQDTGHRWKRKALHAALARAHEAPSESEPPSAGGDTDPSPHGRPLKATEPPTSFSSALASASGSVDWSIIHDKIPMQRKQQVSLHQWMITLPAPTD